MATWRAIEFVGQTLVQLLQQEALGPLGPQRVQVQLATPTTFPELARGDTPSITLFLFRVVEHAETRNQPFRTGPAGTVLPPPLPLELSYLVTPWAGRLQTNATAEADAAATEHRLLGLILRTFRQFAEVGRAHLVDPTVGDLVWSPNDSLQIVLDSLPIEDQYRIWDAGELPYRLSVAYRVRVVAIDADPLPATPPVRDALLGAGGGR